MALPSRRSTISDTLSNIRVRYQWHYLTTRIAATTAPTAPGQSWNLASPAAPAKWGVPPGTTAASATLCSGFSAPAHLGATCPRTTATVARLIAGLAAGGRREPGPGRWTSCLSTLIGVADD